MTSNHTTFSYKDQEIRESLLARAPTTVSFFTAGTMHQPVDVAVGLVTAVELYGNLPLHTCNSPKRSILFPCKYLHVDQVAQAGSSHVIYIHASHVQAQACVRVILRNIRTDPTRRKVIFQIILFLLNTNEQTFPEIPPSKNFPLLIYYEVCTYFSQLNRICPST